VAVQAPSPMSRSHHSLRSVPYTKYAVPNSFASAEPPHYPRILEEPDADLHTAHNEKIAKSGLDVRYASDLNAGFSLSPMRYRQHGETLLNYHGDRNLL